MAKKLKIWNGASWEDVTFAITPPTTNITNSFTTNQVIDTSTSVAALRITQRGTGEALRVEDDTNPDSTPFIISASGNVGIGTSNPLDKLHVEGEIRTNALHSTSNSDSLELYASNTFNSNGDGAISIRGTQSGFNNGGMEFYAGGAERMRIASDGNVTVSSGGLILSNGVLTINSTQSVTGADWANGMLQITGNSGAANNPGIAFHAPGVSAISLYHVRGWQGLSVLGNSGTTDTGSGRGVIRNIAISTSNPSGGSDGDMWAVYV